MKITQVIKNLFVVQSPDGTERLSEAMVTNTVVLVSSILVAAGGSTLAIPAIEIAAITAGAKAIWDIGIRYRSKGGTLKAKDESNWVNADDNEGWSDGGS